MHACLAGRPGTVAITTAAIAAPLIVLLAAALKFTRAEYGEEKLQAALDAAVLTLAQADDASDDPRPVVRASVDANLNGTVSPPETVVFNILVAEDAARWTEARRKENMLVYTVGFDVSDAAMLSL